MGERRLVPELGSWQGELNLTWRALKGKPFTALLSETKSLIEHIRQGVRQLDPKADIVFIGTLPNVGESDVEPSKLTALERYDLLQAGIWNKAPAHTVTVTSLNGFSHEVRVKSLGPEAYCTSQQPHFYLPRVDFCDIHNTIVATAAPLQAIFGNAPFADYLEGEQDGRLFWMAAGTRGRVFANGYIRSPLQQFEEATDTARYPVILTTKDTENTAAVIARGEVPTLASLHRQKGTVWPAITRDVFDAKARHIRSEPRYLSAGPVITMLSSAAFLGGLLHNETARRIYRLIPEAVAIENFQAANRDGVNATIRWPSTSGELIWVPACEVASHLLPLAQKGLASAGVEPNEARRFLRPAHASAQGRLSGAAWQSRRVAFHKRQGLAHKAAIDLMTREYVYCCDGGLGLHFTDWPKPHLSWNLSMLI